MSGLLFDLILHAATSKVNAHVNLIFESRQIGSYAYDIVILGHKTNAVRETFIELEEQIKKARLTINHDKTNTGYWKLQL